MFPPNIKPCRSPAARSFFSLTCNAAQGKRLYAPVIYRDTCLSNLHCMEKGEATQRSVRRNSSFALSSKPDFRLLQPSTVPSPFAGPGWMALGHDSPDRPAWPARRFRRTGFILLRTSTTGNVIKASQEVRFINLAILSLYFSYIIIIMVIYAVEFVIFYNCHDPTTPNVNKTTRYYSKHFASFGSLSHQDSGQRKLICYKFVVYPIATKGLTNEKV